MKQIKTAELTGAALDWVVANCYGVTVTNTKQSSGYIETAWDSVTKWENACEPYHPSTNWEQGGPIIEREKIGVTFRDERDEWEVPNWSAWPTQTDDRQEIMGQTPLIAAMRCYVASKLGDTVEVPEGLC